MLSKEYGALQWQCKRNNINIIRKIFFTENENKNREMLAR